MSLPWALCIGICIAAAATMAVVVWRTPSLDEYEFHGSALGDFPNLPPEMLP